MEKQEFKNAMQLLDKSIDEMFLGDYEKVNNIVEVTEKLILDAKYPRKWFNYYGSYTLEKLYKKLEKKYGYKVEFSAVNDARLMQARKHELQGEKDYIHFLNSGEFNLKEMSRYATPQEVNTIRVICRAFGELAYKHKKVITLA